MMHQYLRELILAWQWAAWGLDAAIEAADIVIMTDEPSKIVTAIKVAKGLGKL